MKRIISIILVMVMVLSSPGQVLATYEGQGTDNRMEDFVNEVDSHDSQQTSDQGTYPTGLLEDEVIEVEVNRNTMLTQATPMFQNARPLSEEYEHAWDTYSTNYFYNLSTDEEKELLWEALDEVCRGYLATNADAVEMELDDETSVYHTGFMDVVGWTEDEVHEFVQMFRVNNPQYYFLNNMFLYGTYETTVTFSLGIYNAFADGGERAEATEAFGAQVDAWKEELASCTAEEEMIYEIHRLICEKVDYNDAIYDSDFDEETTFTQSAYSVMCMDYTVCAGYAEAVALMCNAMGIDALCVTSYNHQWNKVRIEDQWYNVDATWADQDSGIYYEYYLRNDAYYDSTDVQNESHAEETFWVEYLPVCSLDSSPSDYSEPGTLPTISMTVEAPTITVAGVEGNYQVSIYSEIDGAKIYYTVDGVTPSVAFTKSIYGGASVTETFATMEEIGQIQAIAVLDGFHDSAVATWDEQSGENFEDKKVEISSLQSVLTGVRIEWTSVSGAEGYNIYRRDGGSATSEWIKVNTIFGNATFEYVDTTVESGDVFYYIVKAYQGSLESKGTDSYIGFYDMPQIQSIVQDEYTMTVSWEAVNEATFYDLYVNVGGEIGWGNWTLEASTTELSGTFTFILGAQDVQPGDIIKFIVVAEGRGGYSVWDEALATEYIFESWEGLVVNPFNDVTEDAYYYKPVLWAYENNVTAGITENQFGPDVTCTRGQIVTFLWRALGKPSSNLSTNPFTDVSSGEYYEEAVLWAYENNITAGITATEFGPDQECTRAQIVTFLWRAFGCQEPQSNVNPFGDVAVNTYYTKAVLWAVENGITAGLSPTQFGPENSCTRGQVVSFLYRAYKE